MMDRTNSNTSSLSRDRVISSEVHVPCSVDAIFDNPKQVWKNRFSQFIVILIGAAAMAATYPGRTHGLGMVTEPLLNDFGLATDDGRVIFSSINFWATLIGSAFCLPIGWLFDRYDRRWVLAINLLLLGCVVLGMSQVTDLQMLSVTIMLTRGLGQSALSVVSISIVAKSFPAQRLGLAMAWYAILSALFHLALINGVAWAFTFEGVTWRTVWFGIGIALVTLSAAAMLLPRITLPNEQREAPTGASALTGYTLKESLRTPAFWTFSLTISLWGMIYAGVSLFNEDIFRERGFDRGLYFRVLSEVTIVAIASKFFFGWMVNYVSLNRLLALCLFVTALSLAGLTRATEEWHAYAYGIGLGIASGAVALLFFAAWGKMYGMRELGQIQGAAQMLTVFASAAGPLVFSLAKRESNSYSTVFLSLAVAILFMAIASILTPLPHPWKHPQLDNQKDTH